MDQPLVESLVRLTVRASAVCFAAALLLVAASDRRQPWRLAYARRALVGCVLAHTAHFAAVIWLARLTAGENIDARGGWPVALGVGLLFYLSALGILFMWGSLADGGFPSRGARLAAHLGIVFISLVFVNSYVSRVDRMPVYWLPTVVMIAAVGLYFRRGQRA